MTQPSLLAIFAHPDDEAFSSGGTLARYASRGVRVTLISTTRGEAGKISDPAMGSVENIGALREAELRDACRHLGIDEPVFLGYRDSGRGERLRKDDPLASINADPIEMEARILEVIERVRPQVMLTFDPHGGYGHPDHLVAHRAALGAFQRAGTLGAGVPQRLFYTAQSLERMRAMMNRPVPEGANPGVFAGLDPEIYAVSESTLAVVADVSDFVDRKLAALRAHRSQTGPLSGIGTLSPDQLREVMRFECFSLGGLRGPVQRWPLRGFFDGLETFESLEVFEQV
ncbi:N-acetyl-1-D-myo-inositol-2-amino-2-deoxy-alpha-D-glucopyranoside deacetylase [Deinobacterium chartae]|uniref:N-acetyl-1-D-myo-inositol-2-amino-2-deoxy-alpha-D-glucopyranoside deacetylase n=1 Tax=Deinobacterium chartae TaxID=521158 RepID=A0A841I0M2_9DEIO|nr:PIG-L deacetylase family protein [Deinobacterium chartae]MBB6098524.1 N-acetyl-1-D-myo-inositol-2-amino-2-deoxy-alpha-D-glucopyranoside deacetylase [Deinobacterium chartae]